jgi:hypothetical protein
VALKVTGSSVHDSLVLPELLEQIPGRVCQVSGDGAYDTRSYYEPSMDGAPWRLFHLARARLPGRQTGARLPKCEIQTYAVFGNMVGTNGENRVVAPGRVSQRMSSRDSRHCLAGASPLDDLIINMWK